MKSFLLFLSITFICTLSLIAQEAGQNTDAPIVLEESIELPESMQQNIDSLLNNWLVRNHITFDGECNPADYNPTLSDEEYIDRLSRIPSVMEMSYNEIVKKYIELYTGRLRKSISFMLGANNFYMPIFEEALDAYDIPNELKYLPVIESALNPNAVSRAGASGLWQFMLSTGRIYGLESNSLIDERRDPIKSTWAAAQYLRDLYTIYNDWNLVIAAYNCGPGNINKAIRRANGEKDYWAIYNYLPKETRGYVPAFIAANYVMTYYCDHNICPMEFQLPAITDTIIVDREIHFEQIADICDINVDQIRSLNPQYRKDVIPGHTKPSTIRLPRNYISTFIDSQDTIYNHRVTELFTKRKTVEVKSTPATARQSSYSGNATTHKIQKGETLSTIAKKYGVSVADIRKWNNLTNNNIVAGKTLRISAPATTTAASTQQSTPSGNVTNHKIQKGETLSTIASKYGVTATDIRKWNNLKNNNIIAGKSLKIYK